MDRRRGGKLDFLQIRKKSLVKTQAPRSSFAKIKIDKNGTKKAKKRRVLKIALVVLFLFALSSIALFTRTTYYQIISLARSLKNETFIVGFQNSAELRPTGGFWGSFALWEIKKNALNGELAFETNPYKADNKILSESNVPLPEPMAQTWRDRSQSFVNANWSFDFPTAAKTIEWYFSQGWNKKSDGVIAISSLAVIDLLDLVGEIQIDDKTSVKSKNFSQVMSEKIDQEYWLDPKNKEINEPKTLIKELAPVFIEKIKKVSKIKLLLFAKKQVESGRILVFFNDEDRQKVSKKMRISGEVLGGQSDYLYVVNANLNGGKSSLNIEQSVDYTVDKNIEGNLESKLKITRFHKDNLWPEILNRNYQRVVVPLGSKLISAKLEGEDVTGSVVVEEDQGRSVFGYWFSTDSGESKTMELTYSPPASISKNYSLIYQKQAGTISEQLKITRFSKKVFDGSFDRLFATF